MLIVMISEGTPFEYSVSTILLDLLTSQFFGPASRRNEQQTIFPSDRLSTPQKGLFSLTTDMNTRCSFPRFPLFYVEEKELRINHRRQSK